MGTDYDLRNEALRAYSILLGLVVRLVEAKARTKIQPGEGWRNDGQRLARKLFQHAVSMQNLAGGATVEFEGGGELGFIDYGSMCVVTRAALETFLVWHHIYACRDEALSRYRYATWKLSGLIDRQNFYVVGSPAADVKQRELPAVQQLLEEVQRSPFFKRLTHRQQEKVLEGKWKIGTGPSEMARAAGFHDHHFSNIHNYFCAYAHAGYLSALQVGQEASIPDQQRMADFVICIGVVVLAHFACSYPIQFPEVQAVLDAEPTAKAVAEQWALRAEDLNASYGTAG